MAKFDLFSIFKRKTKTEKEPAKVAAKKSIEEMTFDELMRVYNENADKYADMLLKKINQAELDAVEIQMEHVVELLTAMCADLSNAEAQAFVATIEQMYEDGFRSKKNMKKRLKEIDSKLDRLSNLETKQMLAEVLGDDPLSAEEKAEYESLKKEEFDLKRERSYLSTKVQLDAELKISTARKNIATFKISTSKIQEIEEERKRDEEQEVQELLKEFEEGQKDKKIRDDGDGQTSPTGNEDDGFGPGNF